MPQPVIIPNEEDWVNSQPLDDLDEADAKENFFGKSIAEVLEGAGFTEGNPMCRGWELQAISKRAFQYYIFAMRDFTLSTPTGRREEASTAASCFLRMIRNKLTRSPNFVLSIYDELQPSLDFIANNQLLFDADLLIYGDFKETFAEIEALVAAARST